MVPAIALADFKSFTVENRSSKSTDADVDEPIKRSPPELPLSPPRPRGQGRTGDRITISFKGSIDGVPFDGGTGEGIQVVIGAGQFIPGFEQQLIGIAAGETRTLKVSFPKNYASEKLAGQAAEFETTATAIEAPQDSVVDDEFAKTLGLESLDKLKEAARERLVAEFAGATRQKVKRMLLDRLDEAHRFEAPPSLVEEEFNLMWNSIKAEMKSGGKTFADEDTTGRGRQGRIPEDRRPPGPARPGAVRDRREEQDHGHRRRSQPRGDRARAPDARPREGSLGLLSQQYQCARPSFVHRSTRTRWSISSSNWPT